MKEGARAEKIKNSDAILICSHVPAWAGDDDDVYLDKSQTRGVNLSSTCET
jgi:hypothetical protein